MVCFSNFHWSTTAELHYLIKPRSQCTFITMDQTPQLCILDIVFLSKDVRVHRLYWRYKNKQLLAYPASLDEGRKQSKAHRRPAVFEIRDNNTSKTRIFSQNVASWFHFKIDIFKYTEALSHHSFWERDAQLMRQRAVSSGQVFSRLFSITCFQCGSSCLPISVVQSTGPEHSS